MSGLQTINMKGKSAHLSSSNLHCGEMSEVHQGELRDGVVAGFKVVNFDSYVVSHRLSLWQGQMPGSRTVHEREQECSKPLL